MKEPDGRKKYNIVKEVEGKEVDGRRIWLGAICEWEDELDVSVCGWQEKVDRKGG